MSKDALRYTAQEGVLDKQTAYLDGSVTSFYETIPLRPEQHKEDNQDIRLSLFTVAEPKQTILVPPAWSDYAGRPFHEHRLALMAQTAEAQVVAIDIPGMGDPAPHYRNIEDIETYLDISIGDGAIDYTKSNDLLTDRQLKELSLRGDFGLLGKNAIDAILDSEFVDLAILENDPLVLYGYSMGGAMVGALYESLQAEGIAVTDIVLWEAIMARAKLGKRALEFMAAGSELKYYMSLNPDDLDVGGGSLFSLAKQVVSQRRSHFATGKAMAISSAPSKLITSLSKGSDQPTVHVWSGTDSSISKPVDNVGFAIELLGRNYPLTKLDQVLIAGESHGMQDALPLVPHMLGRLSLHR